MAQNTEKYNTNKRPTWCPGCGNFGIHMALKTALAELEIAPSETFIAFDIGCNGNGADTISTYGFKGLHGRAVALASGAKLANKKFTVIADQGDGACFHEGIDHLVNAIKSNYDITILIHNNENFALTTGQATVTTNQDKPMYGQPYGKPEKGFNINEFIMSLHPTFFAKGYSGDIKELKDLIKKGIKHHGCSVIEISQLCPSYNKEATPQWFNEHITKVSTLKDYSNKSYDKAMELSKKMTNDKLYTGVIYQQNNVESFYDNLKNRKNYKTELVDEVKEYNIKPLLKYFE